MTPRKSSPTRKGLCLLLLGAALAAPAAFAQKNTVKAAQVAPGVLSTGKIQNNDITESSGLVASRRFAGVFWTHNDQGNADRLYAINRQGKSIGTFSITGANIKDWEDIAIDSSGNLYIADIGNNDGQRKTVEVYQIREPNPQGSGKVAIQRSWTLKFPGQPFDAESLFVANGTGYIIAKQPGNGGVTMYYFSLAATKQTVTLKPVTKLKIAVPVTGADLSADKSRLGVITESGAYLFLVNGQMWKAGQVKPQFTPFQHQNMEGGAFAGNGFLVSAESGDLFLFNQPFFRAR